MENRQVSWKPEFSTRENEWNSNALRFATKAECDSYATDLSMRWTAVRDIRCVECNDPVNYAWRDGRLEAV